MRILKSTGLLGLAILLLSFSPDRSSKDEDPPIKKVVSELDLGDGMYAQLRTSMGSIYLRLYFDATPLTVANFVGLAEGEIPNESKGEKQPYYDSTIFHRVIDHFMVQGGDPTGTGMGGPGYKFKDEIVDSLKHDGPGVLSMANAGPGTNGSQFFITHQATPWLNGRHTVFGQVVKGQEIVDAMGKVETVGANRPIQPIYILGVDIYRKGKAARKFNALKTFNKLK